MPGDRIKLVDKVVYRNGSALTEPYATHKSAFMDAYRDNFPAGSPPAAQGAEDMLAHHLVNGEVVVPEGKYLSAGAIIATIRGTAATGGFSGREDVLGKPFLIYDSEQPPSGNGAHPTRLGRGFSSSCRLRIRAGTTSLCCCAPWRSHSWLRVETPNS